MYSKTVQCEEGHDAVIECEERMCPRDCEYTLCQYHMSAKEDDSKDRGYEQGVSDAEHVVKTVMEGWEMVTDIDNPVSIVDLKKELLEKINKLNPWTQ